MRGLTATALPLLFAAVAVARVPGPYDETLPISFVGTQAAVLNGRPVDLIGIAPGYVRVVYDNSKKTVTNDRIESLRIDGAKWAYEPRSMSFNELVGRLADEEDRAEAFGAVAGTDAVRAAFGEVEAPSASGDSGQVGDEPEPAGRVGKPLPPPPVAKSRRTPVAAAPPAAVADPPPPQGGVPDWVKYLCVAAGAVFVVKLIRG